MCTCLFLLCPSGLWFLMWFARVSLRTWTRSACGSRTASRCRPSRPPSRYWPRSFCGYHQALSSLDNLYTTRDSVLIVMADFDHAAAYRRHRFWLEEEVWRCRRGRGARRGEGGDIRPLLFDPIFFFLRCPRLMCGPMMLCTVLFCCWLCFSHLMKRAEGSQSLCWLPVPRLHFQDCLSQSSSHPIHEGASEMHLQTPAQALIGISRINRFTVLVHAQRQAQLREMEPN